MGRPRGGKVSSSSDATAKVDPKSKVIRTSTRERKEILHNYNEDSHSESEEQEEREEPEVVSDFEQSLSESISEGESSGSEYGVKKSKKSAKVSPKKGGRGSVGRGRGKGSPKGKGKRGAAAKPKGRPGRKPKAPSTPVTKTRPSRGQPNKRMKYRERSDSEEESEPELSDESEPEEPIESESDVEEELPKSDSASDGESKSRKRKAPQSKGGSRGRPAKTASPGSGKNNVKATAAKNGSEKKESKNKLSDESDGFDEDDEGPAESKKEKIEKKVVASNGESSEDGGVGEDNGEKEKPVAPPTASTKSDRKAKAAAPTSSEGEDDDVEMKSDEDDDKAEEPEKTLKNATETDYKLLNFDCDKKTSKGEAWNFKISCWNIGGIKAWVKKNGLEFLKREDPDIMCLQEVRSSEKTQPPEVKIIENYPHIYWCFAEAGGHHGIGLLSKTKPLNVQIGFPVKDDDSDDDKKFKNMFNKEGRLIVAEYDNIFAVNAYVPNGGRGEKIDAGKPYPHRVTNGERQEWDRLFRNYLKELDAKKPVVVIGDLNVAHTEIDLANPKTNTSTAGFTKEEREGFDTLLQETGLIDSYRLLYPNEKGAYTFWTYKYNARQKNVGWRLDYFLVSEKLKENVAENTMRSQVLGSDHCPVTLMIHV